MNFSNTLVDELLVDLFVIKIVLGLILTELLAAFSTIIVFFEC